MKRFSTIFGLISIIVFIAWSYSYSDTRHFPNRKPGTEKWIFGAGDSIHTSPAVGKDGTIYILLHSPSSYYLNYYLYAINSDGTVKWKNLYTDSSSPAIGADGTIYLGCDGGILEAINPDGTEKWETGVSIGYFSDLAIGKDGTIYADGKDPGDGVYAINPNGSIKWHFTTSDAGDFSAPSVGPDGTVYASPLYSNILYAISSDGKLKWKYAIDKGKCSPAAIGEGGTIYVNAYTDNSADSYLYAINPDGTLKWKSPTSRGAEYAPAIGKDGTIYVALEEGYLYAINPDGTLKWKTNNQIYGPIDCSPTIGSDGIIYISSAYDFTDTDTYDSFIYAINPKDGTFVWRPCDIPKVVKGLSMAIGSNGNLYATYRGGVVSINSSSEGLADSAWPRARHDNKNTGRLSSDQTCLSDPTSHNRLTYISTDKGRINNAKIMDLQQAEDSNTINTDNMPSNIAYINKVVKMDINNIDNGSSVTITISNLYASSNSVFYKYVNGQWINLETCDNCSFTSKTDANGTYTISFVVKDNGMLDSDNASGVIKDPIVVGTQESFNSLPPPPTSNSTTLSSGGCTTSNTSSAGLIFILLAGLGFGIRKKLQKN